jgi:deoxycytidylate deaminase
MPLASTTGCFAIEFGIQNPSCQRKFTTVLRPEMANSLNRIEFPELIFGFVAPIGADIDAVVAEFQRYLHEKEYNVIVLKVTDAFTNLSGKLLPDVPLNNTPRTFERFDTYIKYGNKLRAHFDDDAFLAMVACAQIVKARVKPGTPEKNAYLLRQFKRKEEIELLRSIYGRIFFQISVYSRRGARVDHLARQFAHSAYSANQNLYRSKAEAIVQIDESQTDFGHGQQVSAIFHDADLVINADVGGTNVRKQVERFSDLLFGSNSISPNKIEYGMFAAKAAALRTLDLSRQVGAAIFSSDGEIITMGSNEVPKALGGTYWSDEAHELDDRDYVRGYDANDRIKRERLIELLTILGVDNPEERLTEKKVRESQFMDALEYTRVIHAEMSAITDAARLGRSLRGATLFCTTFPCHMCAKHIVAAGIVRVIFLEPYPKSLTSDLHSDAAAIEGADRGKHQQFPSIWFDHFWGVSPRRYREIFERQRRKDRAGNFVEWNMDNIARPIVDLKFPFYMSLEAAILQNLSNYLDTLGMTVDNLTGPQAAKDDEKTDGGSPSLWATWNM